jgi:hypothetical protein
MLPDGSFTRSHDLANNPVRCQERFYELMQGEPSHDVA